MQDRQSSGFWPMVSGFILGGVVGAGAMFFMAPRSGKASRQLLKSKVDEFSDYVQEEKEILEQKVQDIFGEVNSLTMSLFEDTRKLWDNQVKTFEKSMQKIDKKKYQDMVDNVIEKLQVSKKYDNSDLGKVKRYLNNQWQKFNELLD